MANGRFKSSWGNGGVSSGNGGRNTSCPRGTHSMPDGSCMDDNDPSMGGYGTRRPSRPGNNVQGAWPSWQHFCGHDPNPTPTSGMRRQRPGNNVQGAWPTWQHFCGHDPNPTPTSGMRGRRPGNNVQGSWPDPTNWMGCGVPRRPITR